MMQWLRWGAKEAPFFHHVRTIAISEDDLNRLMEWCRDTIGPVPEDAGDDARWKVWARLQRINVLGGDPTYIVEFGFRHEADCVLFVLAWSGVQTP